LYRSFATGALKRFRFARRRLGWQWARLRPEISCSIERGAVLTVPSDSRIARGLYDGFYERREREFLSRFLRPTDVFFDVGANVGLYSVLAATVIDRRGAVYSFEPNQLALGFLRRNMGRMSKCRSTIFGLALSDAIGELELSVPAQGFDAWATLGTVATLDGVAKSERVATTTLDALLERAEVEAPTVVKIDVEGWELRVLRGGSVALHGAEPPLLMVELCDRASEGAGSSTAELLDAIEAMGMKVFELGADARTLVPHERRDEYPYLNIFAATPGSDAARRIQEMLVT
jgi:FkbM family methyltransferase